MNTTIIEKPSVRIYFASTKLQILIMRHIIVYVVVSYNKTYKTFSDFFSKHKSHQFLNIRKLLLLSTHSSLLFGRSPLLLSYEGSPPASPASHLAGLLRRRDPSTNPGPIAWCVSVGN